MRILLIWILFIAVSTTVLSRNPIIPNQGANDPHIRIIDGRAYFSASHDKSMDNSTFIMEDWWLWSSDDLVNWELEYVLKPEDTYIGEPFNGCWATDFVKRNGKYYWYFSERNRQAGVMVADSPSGPWKDPLGKPLLPENLTPTHEYDMGIFEDTDGEFYIVFGVWDFYIARLNEDMISLAEKPRKINIHNPRGPYNPDGTNSEKPTDDKPFLHLFNGKYYLSWGCFYAMSDHLYGPYDYTGSVIEQESFAPGYDRPTWPNGFKQGRHGSFFEWHNQWYYAYCDISQTGNRYFRDTFISYVHYRENGEMSLIRVDGTGVGEYDANHPIEAEDYFMASRMMKKELANGGFGIGPLTNHDSLVFNHVNNLADKSKIRLTANVFKPSSVIIQAKGADGKKIVTCLLSKSNHFESFIFDLPDFRTAKNIVMLFKGENGDLLEIDALDFID
jgi:arabinoxylan arabinofuranohydrolase